MFTLVAITADELRPDGQPASGTLTATLSGPMENGTQSIDPTPVSGILQGGRAFDDSGTLPFILAAVDDVATTPAGQTYDFVIELDGAPVLTFTAAVSHLAPVVDGVPTVDLSVLIE